MPQLSQSWSVSEFLIQPYEMFFELHLEACPDLCVHVWEVGVGGVVAAVTQPWQVNTLDKWDDLGMSHYPHYILIFFRHSPTLQYSFTLASSRWMFAKVKCFTFRSSLLRLSLSIIQCPGDSTILYNLSTVNLRILRFLPCKKKGCDWKTGFDKMMYEIILCCEVW